MTVSTDYIFRTFSSAAPGISALAAFGLAGYALVYNLMGTELVKNDALKDVYDPLLSSYHNTLRIVAWLSVTAILTSLELIYLNGYGTTPVWCIVIVSVIDLIAVIVSIDFVVSIIDTQKGINGAIKEVRDTEGAGLTIIPVKNFFGKCTYLEKTVRDFLQKNNMYRGLQQLLSFRQMIYVLYRNKTIDRELLEELQDINRYRNLIFRGLMSDVTVDMMSLVVDATSKAEQCFNKYDGGELNSTKE
ncbi:MAG: hypothetical protein HQK99_09550 [Nitrospirae bacterium]|nr:hypothetical protein [Nitrospirota bacterium]